MIKFKSDDRLFIAAFAFGIMLLAFGYYVSLKHYKVGLVTCFWLLPGFLFITAVSLKRELVSIDNDYLIIKNRLNVLSKYIRLEEIKKVKAIEKEHSFPGSQSILHLLLWDEKFKRVKDIEIFGAKGIKIFTIDARAIDNAAYVQLLRRIKK